jgi:hypothetical protein
MRRALCLCGWRPAKHAAGKTRAACAGEGDGHTRPSVWQGDVTTPRPVQCMYKTLPCLQMRQAQAPKSTTALGRSKEPSPATQELDHLAGRARGLGAWPGQASLRIARPSFCTSQHSHCPSVPPRLRALLLPVDWRRCGSERPNTVPLACISSKRLALAARPAVPCAWKPA